MQFVITDGIISNLKSAQSYYVRILDNDSKEQEFHSSVTTDVASKNATEKRDEISCTHRGKTYEVGKQWHDECIAICICLPSGETRCATIECPTEFGLDVLDPYCIEWETVPPNHVPIAPNCCPEVSSVGFFYFWKWNTKFRSFYKYFRII